MFYFCHLRLFRVSGFALRISPQSGSRYAGLFKEVPVAPAARAASTLQIPEPWVAINKKMKQNSTAGSPAFSSGQKLFGKWAMK
jgi:hypothetical protein